MIEMDEGYFIIEVAEIERNKRVRGRGATGKLNVVIMAEFTVLEDVNTCKMQRRCGFFKAKVLENYKTEGINKTIHESIENTSIVFTDKSTSYIDIANFVELHYTEKSDKQTTIKTLKWMHITISNAKETY